VGGWGGKVSENIKRPRRENTLLCCVAALDMSGFVSYRVAGAVEIAAAQTKVYTVLCKRPAAIAVSLFPRQFFCNNGLDFPNLNEKSLCSI